jgi:hypothetical protein
MSLTLSQWWQLDADGRAVVLDQLLERTPPGFVDPRAVGHDAGPLPQLIHQETNVLFHVVFGGRGVLGMSEPRFERLRHVTVHEEEDMMVPVPRLDEAKELRPSREIFVPTALVADEPLSFGVLRKLGLEEAKLSSSGVSPVQVGALLKALIPQRWRAPSEAEWEFVCRAAEDSTDDAAPPTAPTARLRGTGLAKMGTRVELCRDSWHDDLSNHPAEGPQGTGHDVLRGHGSGARFAGYGMVAAWNEALWPGRRRLASWRQSVAIRPWVDLLK